MEQSPTRRIALLALLACAGWMAQATQVEAATYVRCSTAEMTTTSQTTTTAGAAARKSAPTYRIDAADFPSGGVLRTGIVWAIDEWNKNAHALTLSRSFPNTTTPSPVDTLNDIYVDNGSTDPACAIACASIYQSCSRGIISSDIKFKTTPSYVAANGALHNAYVANGAIDARVVALHELAHSIGIGHTANRYSVMGDDFRFHHTNGATEIALFNYPYVGSDTTQAALALYGAKSGPKPEISVSHWVFWKNADSTYSAHRFAKIYPTGSNTALPTRNLFTTCPSDAAGNTQVACAYDVNLGQVVDVEFTHENTGAVGVSAVSHRLKLSTDSTIAGGDTNLGSTVLHDYPLGVPIVRRHRVTIPNNLARNQYYYIGMIADSSNGVAELREDPLGSSAPPAWTGNAAWVPIYVK